MKIFSAQLSKSNVFLIVIFFVYLSAVVLPNTARRVQEALAQHSEMEESLKPTAEIETFRSLVPEQPLHPEVTKVIGRAGGIVELPHVARLEIPENALSYPVSIKIIQVLKVESIKESCANLPPSFGTCLPGDEFITPVVRLEPFGLKLNTAAKLFLPTDAARVGNNSPDMIESIASETAKNEEWVQDSSYFDGLGIPLNQAARIQQEMRIKKFVYFAKSFPTNVSPSAGATSGIVALNASPGNSADFTVKQKIK